MTNARAELVPAAQAVALALRGVLKNALEAVGDVGRSCCGSRAMVAPAARGGARSRQRHELRRSRPGREPFFTTKERARAWPGVFVARALCEQLGGKLEIESVEGRGTTVRMSVPLQLPAHGAAKMEPA